MQVLDTNSILYHLGGKLTEPLPDAKPYAISVISEIELLSYPNLSAPEQTLIKTFLAAHSLIDLSPEIRKKTIQVRQQYRLKLPDAIIVSTAIHLNASLLTNDNALLKIPLLQSHSIPIIPTE
jgi:predicted nucleic acid-binding protein